MLHEEPVAGVTIMCKAFPHVRDAKRREELGRRICVKLVSDGCQSCLRGSFQNGQLRLRADFLRTAFVSTGFLVKADRSEDHLIRIDGFNNYDFK